MKRKVYALLVGINEYPNPYLCLHGCVGDAERVERFLRGRVASDENVVDIVKLLNDEATRPAIIDAFRTHLSNASQDDIVLFYYSGHGSQETAPSEFWHIEPDRLNETLLCWDSQQDGCWHLADKELAKLIAEVAQNDPHIVVILDCCHSGSGTRGEDLLVAEKFAPKEPRQRPLNSYIFSIDELKALQLPNDDFAGSATRRVMQQGGHILLAACQDGETAKEIYNQGAYRGAFSSSLLDLLEQTDDYLSYRDIVKHVRNQIGNQRLNQTPQLEAIGTADINNPFLGGAQKKRTRYFTVSYDHEYEWILDAGAVHGIPVLQADQTIKLALFPLSTPAEKLNLLEEAIGYATVLEVSPQFSKVAVQEITNTALTYKAIMVEQPVPPLGIELAGDSEGLGFVRTALAAAGPDASPSLYIFEADNAEYCLSARGNTYSILRSADGRVVVDPIRGYSRENALMTVVHLEHIARWYLISQLQNKGRRIPASAIEMTVFSEKKSFVDEPALLEYEYEQGEWMEPEFRIRLKNQHDKPLYCVLYTLSENFSVTGGYFPAGGVWLEPGEEAFAPTRYARVPKSLWQTGVTERQDILKLFVCTAEFDPTLLEQNKLDEPRVLKKRTDSAINSTLSRLMNQIQMREVADRREAELYDDWATAEISLTVRRPQSMVSLADSEQKYYLGAGVHIASHADLYAKASLDTHYHLQRGQLSPILPSILRTDPTVAQPLQITPAKGANAGLSSIHLADVQNHHSISPDHPLTITLESLLASNESVLPVGSDGKFYLPLGYLSRRDSRALEIIIERLPHPTADGNRSIHGSVWILLQKMAAKSWGIDYTYPQLAAVATNKDGEPYKIVESQSIQQRVAEAREVILCIHGFLGDTDHMAETLLELKPYACLLTFNYETINTPLEQTARNLKERLSGIGLAPDHGKQLRVVAYSMGGLVARWLLEREDGDQMVQQLLLVGTPNTGSPWPALHDWGTMALGVALNGMAATNWPVQLITGLLGVIERVDTSFDQLHPSSDFLDTLNSSQRVDTAYHLIAGNTSLIPATLEQESDTSPGLFIQLLNRLALNQVMKWLVSKPFFDEPNDLFASSHSLLAPDVESLSSAERHQVQCDHLTYFRETGSRQLLQELLSRPLS